MSRQTNKILGQIEKVDPEKLASCLKEINGNMDPALSARLLATRDRLNALLAVVKGKVEDGYRTPPIVEQVPSTPPTIEPSSAPPALDSPPTQPSSATPLKIKPLSYRSLPK